MVTAERVRELLSVHGVVRSQAPEEWTGLFPLPSSIAQFFREVGPSDITIESYGNPFFLPRLAALWDFQKGYRWNGLTGERIADWNDDWLVVADQGGDPFIFSCTSGKVLYAQHGTGALEPTELFSDLNTMAACLGQLGAVVVSAGESFTDDDCLIRPEHRERAWAGLRSLTGSTLEAEVIVESLDWG
jgi:hypothetical protein